MSDDVYMTTHDMVKEIRADVKLLSENVQATAVQAAANIIRINDHEARIRHNERANARLGGMGAVGLFSATAITAMAGLAVGVFQLIH